MKSKTKKILVLFILGFGFVCLPIMKLNFNLDTQKSNIIILKESAGYYETSIYIVGSIPNNWSWTAGNNSWCYFDNGYYIIENVTIDASSSPTGSGIYIENSTNDKFIIRNCTIFNADNGFFDSGIWLENTNYGIIINNNCSGNKQGIYLSNCEANNITGNTANNNEYNGIYLEPNCNHNNITGNTANNNLRGIQIAIDCDYNNITLNTVNHNNDGIYINSPVGYPCENNIILNNTANENKGKGICLQGTNYENSIINNSVNDNLVIGIYLHDSDIIRVIGNNIYNNMNGIEGYYCDDSNITGNTINSNLGIGINLGNSDNNEISNNTINKNFETGIYLYQSDSNEIRNNTINRNDLGIRFNDCNYNNITGNDLKDNNWCIYETYCEGNIIEYNDCSPSTVELPIYIDDFATGVDAHNWTWAEGQPWCSGTGTYLDPYILENLKISGFGTDKYGIDIRNSNVFFIIQECQIYNSEEAGIYFDKVNNSRLINNNCSHNDEGIYVEYSNNITIFNNIANNNTSNGIYVSYSNSINITGNTINNNCEDGISKQSCNFCFIIENVGTGNNERGIYLDECFNNSLSENDVNNNDNGIYLTDSDFNRIIGNSACNNSDSGIQIMSDSNNNTISGNIADNNDENGIHLEYCDNNTFLENTANNNEYYGICLDGCDYTIISGNTANNNDDTGIYFESSDDYNTISGNTISNNVVSGIYFYDSDNYYNIISGNIIKNNNHGINIGGDCDNNSIYGNFFLKNGKHALDNGTNNNWNSITIGNYWDNHTSPDTTPQDGIVDDPYMYIGGSAGSMDYLPIAEDGVPSITISSPAPGNSFGDAAPSFTVIITDDYLDEMWYTVDGGVTNYTFTENVTIDQSAWDALSDGTITLTFYASDIPGNIGSADVIITKNPSSGGPNIILIFTIVAISVVGGVVVIGVVYMFMKKRGIIP